MNNELTFLEFLWLFVYKLRGSANARIALREGCVEIIKTYEERPRNFKKIIII